MAIFNRYPDRSYVQAPPLRFDKLGHSTEKEKVTREVALRPTTNVPKNIREILKKVIEKYS